MQLDLIAMRGAKRKLKGLNSKQQETIMKKPVMKEPSHDEETVEAPASPTSPEPKSRSLSAFCSCGQFLCSCVLAYGIFCTVLDALGFYCLRAFGL